MKHELIPKHQQQTTQKHHFAIKAITSQKAYLKTCTKKLPYKKS